MSQCLAETLEKACGPYGKAHGHTCRHRPQPPRAHGPEGPIGAIRAYELWKRRSAFLSLWSKDFYPSAARGDTTGCHGGACDVGCV